MGRAGPHQPHSGSRSTFLRTTPAVSWPAVTEVHVRAAGSFFSVGRSLRQWPARQAGPGCAPPLGRGSRLPDGATSCIQRPSGLRPP
ncbi:hypothetical protein NDU88_001570 [Pleurodeles waltl]|uniref:Uncharacterized protein n=1 Tax=Pleurodeles waltl TaxID=8319 RepID=A0AAV7P736_PLEWA|nr:hypothetical protein NDU88_001570 [Pleurodeles waltl]